MTNHDPFSTPPTVPWSAPPAPSPVPEAQPAPSHRLRHWIIATTAIVTPIALAGVLVSGASDRPKGQIDASATTSDAPTTTAHTTITVATTVATTRAANLTCEHAEAAMDIVAAAESGEANSTRLFRAAHELLSAAATASATVRDETLEIADWLRYYGTEIKGVERLQKSEGPVAADAIRRVLEALPGYLLLVTDEEVIAEGAPHLAATCRFDVTTVKEWFGGVVNYADALEQVMALEGVSDDERYAFLVDEATDALKTKTTLGEQSISGMTDQFLECAAAQPANDLGDDPNCDALHEACRVGDLAACDDLYLVADPVSEYRVFAATCGRRSDPYGPHASGECSSVPFPGADSTAVPTT